MKKKKVTVEIERELADSVKDLARKRGVSLSEIYTSLSVSVLSSDRFLTWAKKESIKELKAKHAA